jgi:hypothetical protein
MESPRKEVAVGLVVLAILVGLGFAFFTDITTSSRNERARGAPKVKSNRTDTAVSIAGEESSPPARHADSDTSSDRGGSLDFLSPAEMAYLDYAARVKKQTEPPFPDEATIFQELVAELGEARARKLLVLLKSDERHRAPNLYNREANIREIREALLSGSLKESEMEKRLGLYGTHFNPLRREEVLSPEFIAELAAKKEHQKQLQLKNIERLRNSPLLPRKLGGDSDDPTSPYGQWHVQHKRITRWGRTPCEPDVKAALIAAFQDRLARLNPRDAVSDDALKYLLVGITQHCAPEASQVLKDYYYGCSDNVLRYWLLNAYAGTLSGDERADLYFQAMTTDPDDFVRQRARDLFHSMLQGRGCENSVEQRAIAEKYAGYKAETFYGIIATGDPHEVARVIGMLNRDVESDVAIVQQIVKTNTDPKVILAAVGFLAGADAMPPAERAQIYREMYERKDNSADVREDCIRALASDEHIKDPQNRALIEKAALGDPDPEVRENAADILKEYEKDRQRFPDECPE